MNLKTSKLDTKQEAPTVQALFEEYKALANESIPLSFVTDAELLLLKDAGVLAEWSRIQREVTHCLRDARIALLSVDVDKVKKRLENLQENLNRLKTLRNKGSDKLNSDKNAHEK